MNVEHTIQSMIDMTEMDWSVQELHQQYIDYHRSLFDMDDWICISDNAKARVNPASISTAIKKSTAFVAVNSFKPNTEGRLKLNVLRHSSFVFEADKEYIDFNTEAKDENGKEIPVPLEKQLRAILESGMPYTTLVFTGSKSVHAIPRLKEDVGSEIYTALHLATQRAMWDDQGLRFDPSCKDASRWTRRPRGTNEKTGGTTILLDYKDRIDLKDYETWLESKGVDWKDHLVQNNAVYLELNYSATAEETHKHIMKTLFKKKANFGVHSRALDAYSYFMAMRGAGVDQHDSLSMAINHFGSVPAKGGETTESILRTENNNVWKKPQSDIPAFAVTNLQVDQIARTNVKAIDANPDASSIDELLESIGVVNSAPGSAVAKPNKRDFFRIRDNYINVNNHIFRNDYDNPNKLNPTRIDKGHWKAKFLFTDTDYQILEEYDGFVNKPSFLDYKKDVGGKYNIFSQVDWKATPGEWPDIEKLLRHHYGKNEFDECQYEEILDYYTVLLKYPEQKQQMRILYSKAQKTAKSAVALLDSYIFQDNWTKIRNNEMESDFNSIWVSMFMLNLDEPYFTDKKKMSKDLRDLITTPYVNLRKMQTDYEKVPFHAKFLITTNDSNFMNFELGDRRYWPRQSPAIIEDNKDNEFMTRVKEQVPHFLYDLLYVREMKYPTRQDETFWLPESITKTNAFKMLVGDTESMLEKALRMVFQNFFEQRVYKDSESVLFKAEDVNLRLEQIQKQSMLLGFKLSDYTQTDVNSTLRDVLGAQQPKSTVRPKKDDVFLVGGQVTEPGRWWRVYKDQFSIERDVFDLKGVTM